MSDATTNPTPAPVPSPAPAPFHPVLAGGLGGLLALLFTTALQYLGSHVEWTSSKPAPAPAVAAAPEVKVDAAASKAHLVTPDGKAYSWSVQSK